MVKTRQFIGLCLVIGMASTADKAALAQGASKRNFTASFQNNYTPLAIGDKVPDFEFNLVNYSTSKAKFSDFKGKYILVDFWATWCSSCLHHFPQLDSLQKQFAGSLQIILANEKNTRDDKEKVVTFFEKRKNKNGLKYQLLSIVLDTILDKLFPHTLIPHYAWIDKDGIVKAITGSETITKENIQTFTKGQELMLKEKKDLSYDLSKPLFLNGNGGTNEKYIYRSMLTGYLDGIPSSSGIFYNDDKKVIRILNTNTTILSLYRQAYPEMAPVPFNRIIINTKLPVMFSNCEEWDTWKYSNAYSYELITPPVTKEKATQMMQDDLAKTFGLYVYFEKVMTNCYVIKKGTKKIAVSKAAKPEINIYEDNGLPKYFHAQPLSTLVNHLNTIISTPVIDETGYDQPLDLDLPTDLTDIKLLKKALAVSGLELIEESRELTIYKLTDTK